MTTAITTDRSTYGAKAASRAAVVAILAIAVLATRIIWFGDPVADIDEQLYSLIGQQMLHGKLPYIDLWDRKSFGLYALYAFAHWTLGPGPIAYQTLAAIFTFAGALLTYHLARDLTDRFGATAAGTLYVIWMAAYASYSGQSEAFHVPLMLGMVWLVRDPDRRDASRRALWAMLLGGLAMQIKVTVLPQCMMLGGCVLYSQWRRGLDLAGVLRLGTLYGLIGAMPTVLVAIFYASISGFDAFIQATITSSFARAAGPLGRFSSRDVVWTNPLMIMAALGIYGAFRVKRPENPARYWFYAVWLLSCLATVFLPSTVYLYYYAAAVPAAVLLVTPLLDRRGPFGPFSALLLVMLGILILQIPDRYQLARTEKAQTTQLAEAIAPHVSHSACLWVYDGPTALYRMTGSCLPTRFIYPDHLNNLLEHDALGTSQPGEVRRILSHKPPVIVAANVPFTVQSPDVAAIVKRTLAQDYRPIASAKMHDRVITAYLRR
ncbi:hypothetical protein GRI58_07930 [Porphyrobacter algicida]|uniref:Glycosyltransferase RgtA/B/C/D-like domain-containing protein n=1 Tax=Qipengyuania algicida TaxID=1836209 RepID=A0A845AP62_9SPHN|nr:glycosyltransferase family 39 protein [Qipengyuania algicida]MXP28748.1 hypothetical protein [Qipengyuania algicida]